MSSISGVSSGINLVSASNGLIALKQDLKTLQSTLQSGNLSAAQSALTAMQNDLQNSPLLTAGSTSTS